MPHPRLLLFALALALTVLLLPLWRYTDPPGSWRQGLQAELRFWPRKAEWVQVVDVSTLATHKQLKVTLPWNHSWVSDGADVITAEVSHFWKKYPGVTRVDLEIGFRNPNYELPMVYFSGTRQSDGLSWTRSGSQKPCLRKLIWLKGDQASVPGILARLRSEHFDPKSGDAIYACPIGWWNQPGSQQVKLEDFLRKALPEKSQERDLWLFQGVDVDELARQRSWLEGIALSGLWSAQAKWDQCCRSGLWIDLG
ncbi:hypothetical protein JST97_12340 [bacterium]|nr:hypothetical protein [bacterium]